jgi:hypothetical protein
MSWENYGNAGWTIDHWLPISLFDLEDSEQLRKVVHWSNLRPMWQTTNYQKWNTHPDELPDDVRAQIPLHFWEAQALPMIEEDAA